MESTLCLKDRVKEFEDSKQWQESSEETAMKFYSVQVGGGGNSSEWQFRFYAESVY